MEHTEAIQTNAPDRYVLGQLSAAEADAFEEHYFDCTACAEDVRLGMSIMEGGRRLVREEVEPAASPAPVAPVVSIDSHSRRGFRWIPAAAVAAMMAIPINVALLMRMQSAATTVIPVAALNPADALRTSDVLVFSERSGDEPFLVTDTFSFNVPTTDEQYSDYTVQILDAAGKVVSEKRYPSQLVDQRPLSVDARVLQPGSYQLVIFGIGPAGQPTRITSGEFIVKRTVKGATQQTGPRRERWNSHTTQAPVPQAA